MVSNDRAGMAAGVGLRDAVVRVFAGNSKGDLYDRRGEKPEPVLTHGNLDARQFPHGWRDDETAVSGDPECRVALASDD